MEDLFRIRRVWALEILDSRGNPTVEAWVETEALRRACFKVPSGASKGKFEALELRDGDKRFMGRGVRKAVKNVNEIIADKIVGLDSRDQRLVDKILVELDGTENKSRLGANAILSVSMAVAKAAAATADLPLYKYLGGVDSYLLPTPMMNIINGGLHAGNRLAFQEFMIIPTGFETFSEALRAGVEVYQTLKQLLKDKYGISAVNVGDEGGFAPPMSRTEEALEMLVKAVEQAGYEPDRQVVLGLDCAASTFYKDGKYLVDQRSYTPGELVDYYLDLVEKYPIKSIEDPFQEDDFYHHSQITRKLEGKVQIVGDDLFVTNKDRLQQGISLGSCNALLFKLNQVGTLTEALEAASTAFRAGYRVIVSHRSGETEDTTIADLSVALNTGLIKTGAPARSERTSKYNRLLEIETELSDQARYPSFMLT